MEEYAGKNILSYRPLTAFLGREIIDWIEWHCEHDTGKKRKVANALREYRNIDPDEYYALYRQNDRCAANYHLYYCKRFNENFKNLYKEFDQYGNQN